MNVRRHTSTEFKRITVRAARQTLTERTDGKMLPRIIRITNAGFYYCLINSAYLGHIGAIGVGIKEERQALVRYHEHEGVERPGAMQRGDVALAALQRDQLEDVAFQGEGADRLARRHVIMIAETRDYRQEYYSDEKQPVKGIPKFFVSCCVSHGTSRGSRL